MANNREHGEDDNRALKEDLRDNVVELNKNISLMIRKKGANLLIKLAAGNDKYYTEFLGAILREDGGYTHAGNLDWERVKIWL